MQYQDPNPENKPFVEEIHRRRNFNNISCNLPSGHYREMYKIAKSQGFKSAQDWESTFPLWKSIDDFIETNSFDVDEFWELYDQGGAKRTQAELSLCPMYIHLRKANFSEKEIIG